MTRMRRRALLVAALACTAGCARPGPEYVVGGGPALSEEAAQRMLVEQLLRRQVYPPLDKPLTAVSVQLPPFPRELRGRGATGGSVRIRFKVGASGHVKDAAVLGSPDPTLAGLVLLSVLAWRFEPITRNGEPAEVPLGYDFVFRIRD